MRAYPMDLRVRGLAAIDAVARKLGIGSPETLRKWIRRAEVDGGQRPGLTTAEHELIKALKKENAELRRANEILKSASAYVGDRCQVPVLARRWRRPS